MPSIVTNSHHGKNSKFNTISIVIALVLLLVACLVVFFRYKKTSLPSAKPIAMKDLLFLAPDEKTEEQIESKHETPVNIENEVQSSLPKDKNTSAKKNNVSEAQGINQPPPENYQVYDPTEKAKIIKAFDSNTERIISGLANTKRGFIPPPMFNLPMQENVMEILDKEIVIYEDDDDKIAQAKENCALLKEELKKYIAEGGTPESFLSWYHNELSKDYNTWKDSQMYIVQLMKEGMVTEAEEYLEKANEELTKAGIRNVTIPENLRKLGEKKLKELQEAAR